MRKLYPVILLIISIIGLFHACKDDNTGLNDLPYYTSEPDTTWEVREQFEYQIIAEDPDPNTKFKVTVVERPAWLSFTEFADQNGVYTDWPLLRGVVPHTALDNDNKVVLGLSDGVIANPVLQEFNIVVRDLETDIAQILNGPYKGYLSWNVVDTTYGDSLAFTVSRILSDSIRVNFTPPKQGLSEFTFRVLYDETLNRAVDNGVQASDSVFLETAFFSLDSIPIFIRLGGQLNWLDGNTEFQFLGRAN